MRNPEVRRDNWLVNDCLLVYLHQLIFSVLSAERILLINVCKFSSRKKIAPDIYRWPWDVRRYDVADWAK